ncbi:MAG: TIGR00266 family protein [Methanospirillum sp.]|nr:TIGR00266 family protein [Methanospirillum sp.]
MQYEIRYRPASAMVVVRLEPGESITAEAGAMTYMSPTVRVSTRKRQNGLLGTIVTSVMGGQSFFVNDLAATETRAEVGLSAAPLGDIGVLEVRPDQGYVVQRSAFVASSQGTDLDVQWQGFSKGLFGNGLFMIRATGAGLLFVNAFGAIDRHALGPGERLVVDNFHLVAFSDTCRYEVRKFGGWKSTILSGEWFVTEIEGPGEVLVQTKSLRELADWLWTVLGPRVEASRAG